MWSSTIRGAQEAPKIFNHPLSERLKLPPSCTWTRFLKISVGETCRKLMNFLWLMVKIHRFPEHVQSLTQWWWNPLNMTGTPVNPRGFGEPRTEFGEALNEEDEERRNLESTAAQVKSGWQLGSHGLVSLYLVGGDWNMTLIFPYIGNNHPNSFSFIFFRGFETTNQVWFIYHILMEDFCQCMEDLLNLWWTDHDVHNAWPQQYGELIRIIHFMTGFIGELMIEHGMEFQNPRERPNMGRGVSITQIGIIKLW